MKLVVASRNRKKINELQVLLHEALGFDFKLELLSLDDIGCTEDIVEDGETFCENALIKARVGAAAGYLCVADDSGLEVDALQGAPGVYSARYSDPGATDERNNEKLLRELEGVPFAERTARFTCAIACVFPDGRYFTVQRSCEGIILFDYHGSAGFGYDPLFYVESLQKTLAEVTMEEKNAISHRGQAIRAFARLLRSQLENVDK